MAPTQHHSTSSCLDTTTAENKSSVSTSSCLTSVNSSITKSSSSSSSDRISSSRNRSSSNSSDSNSRLCEPNLSQQESTGVWEALLPITCRGQFYHDTFFKEARQHFDAAVREVLDEWDHRSTLVDDLTSYRKLRESNLTEANQAVAVSQDDNCHQVVMDVRDFVSGDVKVKVVDEDELVVEGSVEQRQEGSVSKKSFRRRFSFPGLVRPEAVTSTISSDGVLTVTVPKKKVQLTHGAGVNVNKRSVPTNSSTATQEDKENFNKSVNGSNSQSSTRSKITKNTEHNNVKSTHFSLDDEVNKTSRKKTTQTSGSSPDQTSDWLLPISHKGLFFHDSFFAEARQDFESAVKKVLDTWGETPDSDHMTCYRGLRERDLKEENQAVSITEDHQSHKVVMDVRDFVSGDVKVKVVDEDELVVEGSVEQRQEGSVSKKSFRRRFSFPGLVRPEAVTSTMSSDGVLTVTVPKKKQSKATENIVPGANVTSTNTLRTVGKQSSSPVIRDTRGSQQRSSTATKNQVRRSSVDEREKTEKQKRNTESSSDTNVVDKSISQETKTLHIDHDRKHTNTSAANEESWMLDSLLPICHKGLFFQDSFFQDARDSFETAVKEVLTRMGEVKTSADDLSLYRSLRECDLRDENQAMKVSENQHTHQVVIDVSDFMKGDVKVKAVGKNLVEVEGRVEKQEGELKSNKSFCRRFNLPGVVNLDTITSAISSDGVLTIRAPKTSGDASVRTASREERTLHHQDTSEGRDGYPFTHSCSSHQHLVSPRPTSM
ncbi:uncharacterized protein LOC121875506 [Homarus americanus]|uniref:Heat shock protein 22-like 3 n=1 Tax=Homarus americanus TaxID=6706 RepID=A0A8J5MRU1_HOMAM|nr:uncharacterized protein LOC121875506 [Homarus americanus]KAG7161076.1 Heat shock protein 22-like 3 [Homarus americanus]